MRPAGPLPCICDKSTPSARACARTDGEACALRKAASSIGALGAVACIGGAGAIGAAGAAVGGFVGGAAGAGAAGALAGAAGWAALDAGAALAGAAAPAAASSVMIRWPSLTLSPTLTPSDLITPAAGAGTSIVALSDSRVTSESSALTVSPGFTRTSITGTSVKSPMSGTLTSIVLIATSKAGWQRRTTPSMPHQTVHGAALAASMPYFEIASATLAVGSVPSSASAFSAATVIYQRSTSKKRRNFSRVSERPK